MHGAARPGQAPGRIARREKFERPPLDGDSVSVSERLLLLPAELVLFFTSC
jgi:hypothetical protein